VRFFLILTCALVTVACGPQSKTGGWLVFAFQLIIYLVAFKSMTIGGDFNFWKWYKYGGRYMKWYQDRSKFDPRR